MRASADVGRLPPRAAVKPHFPCTPGTKEPGRFFSLREPSTLPNPCLAPEFPLGVCQFLCLFWPRPPLLAAAPRLWACSRISSHHQQALSIASLLGWGSWFCSLCLGSAPSPATGKATMQRCNAKTHRVMDESMVNSWGLHRCAPKVCNLVHYTVLQQENCFKVYQSA